MVKSMLIMCLKIFLARIVDVTLGTIRTILLAKEKTIEPVIIAFFEVIIWFIVAKEALNVADNTLLVAIFYALGYSTGTLIGSYLSKKFNKSIISVEIIVSDNKDKLLDKLRAKGFRVNVISLKKDYNHKAKEMLSMQIKAANLKKVSSIVKSIDNNAYMVVRDIKIVSNGVFK